MIRDKTTNPHIPKWFREELLRICLEANREEEGKPFRLIITEFEVR